MFKTPPRTGKLLLAAALVMGSLPAPQSKETGRLSEEQIQRMYLDYLREEGYKPEVDEDGDVAFKSEGREYYLIVTENDPQLFRLLGGGTWSVESEEERDRCHTAANNATKSTKVAKAYISRDHVRFSASSFISSPDQFRGIFARSLSALNTARDKFVDEMRGSQ